MKASPKSTKNSAKEKKKFILKSNFENPYLFFMTISGKPPVRRNNSDTIPKLEISSPHSNNKKTGETLTSRSKQKLPVSEYLANNKVKGNYFSHHNKSNSMNPHSLIPNSKSKSLQKKAKGVSEVFLDKNFGNSDYYPMQKSSIHEKKDGVLTKHGSAPSITSTLRDDKPISWRIANLKGKLGNEKLLNNLVKTNGKIIQPNPQSPSSKKQKVAVINYPNFEGILQVVKSKRKDISDFNKLVKQTPIFVHKTISKRNKVYFLGMANAHGEFGNEISLKILEFVSELISKDSDLYENTEKALGRSIYFANKKLARSSIDTSLSGSTILVIIIFNGQLYTGVVGDLSASVYEKHRDEVMDVALCQGHHLSIDEERQRIELMGGVLEARGEDKTRVWLGNESFPGVSQSRSIGDLIASQIGIIADPEITEYELVKQTRYLVIHTHNLEEFIPQKKICALMKTHSEDIGDLNEAISEEIKAKDSGHRVDDIGYFIVSFKL